MKSFFQRQFGKNGIHFSSLFQYQAKTYICSFPFLSACGELEGNCGGGRQEGKDIGDGGFRRFNKRGNVRKQKLSAVNLLKF